MPHSCPYRIGAHQTLQYQVTILVTILPLIGVSNGSQGGRKNGAAGEGLGRKARAKICGDIKGLAQNDGFSGRGIVTPGEEKATPPLTA